MLDRRSFFQRAGAAALLASVPYNSIHAKKDKTVKGTPKKELIKNLKAVGKEPVELTNPDASTVLVLPYGGRILGLFAPNSDNNVLWTDTRLGSKEKRYEWYSKDVWHNSGGDRTWLAPEVDFFFPNFPDTGKYFQQRPLDVGPYRVTNRDGGSVTMENEFTMQNYRGKKQYQLRITKTVGPAANPLRQGAVSMPDGVQYAGYTLTCTLDILRSSGDPGYVGLWNLLQMPNGGEMLVPTYTRTDPTVFFGEIPKADLKVEDRMVRYRMRADGAQKICVRALHCTGRAGYTYDTDGDSVLVVRTFDVNPSGDYVDVWSTNMKDDGYAFQACNINLEELGSFSELEYHAPAIGAKTGLKHSRDTSSVWAFRGPRAKVEGLAGTLLALS